MKTPLPCRTWIAVFAFLLATVSLSATAAMTPGQRVAWPAIDLVDGTRLDARGLDGRIVLVVFWATWCPLCRSELPELQHFLAAQRERDLEVLAISLDETPADVREYARRTGFRFRFAMHTPALEAVFGPVEAIPLVLLFDRRGVLRFRRLGALDTRELARQVALLRKAAAGRPLGGAAR